MSEAECEYHLPRTLDLYIPDDGRRGESESSNSSVPRSNESSPLIALPEELIVEISARVCQRPPANLHPSLQGLYLLTSISKRFRQINLPALYQSVTLTIYEPKTTTSQREGGRGWHAFVAFCHLLRSNGSLCRKLTVRLEKGLLCSSAIVPFQGSAVHLTMLDALGVVALSSGSSSLRNPQPNRRRGADNDLEVKQFIQGLGMAFCQIPSISSLSFSGLAMDDIARSLQPLPFNAQFTRLEVTNIPEFQSALWNSTEAGIYHHDNRPFSSLANLVFGGAPTDCLTELAAEVLRGCHILESIRILPANETCDHTCSDRCSMRTMLSSLISVNASHLRILALGHTVATTSLLSLDVGRDLLPSLVDLSLTTSFAIGRRHPDGRPFLSKLFKPVLGSPLESLALDNCVSLPISSFLQLLSANWIKSLKSLSLKGQILNTIAGDDRYTVTGFNAFGSPLPVGVAWTESVTTIAGEQPWNQHEYDELKRIMERRTINLVGFKNTGGPEAGRSGTSLRRRGAIKSFKAKGR